MAMIYKKEIPYPEQPGQRPHVIVVGGGVAGMAAAHRLLERDHDVTLVEANSFLGGKLGAHQDADELDLGHQENHDASAFGQRQCTPCTTPCRKADRARDWHEHCYHMYLNWYHNFWQLMRDIGVIDRFEPMTELTYLRAGDGGKPIVAENPGTLSSMFQNMTCGVASPADVFLHSQALRDLIATPDHADRRLDQLSVEAFLREHPYTTEGSRKATHGVLAKAFAAPTALASASSYKSFLKWGARLPEPTLWLLTGQTEEAIFTPWLRKLASLSGTFTIDWNRPPMRPIFAEILAEHEARNLGENEKAALPSFTFKPRTRVAGMEIDLETGDFLMRIETLDKSPGPQLTATEGTTPYQPVIWRFGGPVVLTIPPRQLARLVHNRADLDRDAYLARTLVGADPALADVTRLKGAPIMTLDIMLKKPLARPLPRGIVLLLDSKYEMSLYDNTQIWRPDENGARGPTQISVCASDADPLMPFVEQKGGVHTIAWMLLQELKRFIDFDPETDVLHCRTHLQTNAGEELFINAVNTWHYRPRTTTAIPGLYIAGDFVQTPIDVVTIEGAAMSGLMAAEAVRRRTGLGSPVPIVVPDALPGVAVKMAAEAMRPMAYAAKAVSEADSALSKGFRQVFPDP